MMMRSKYKIDPKDGGTYTFADVLSYYEWQYSRTQIQEYWDYQCIIPKGKGKDKSKQGNGTGKWTDKDTGSGWNKQEEGRNKKGEGNRGRNKQGKGAGQGKDKDTMSISVTVLRPNGDTFWGPESVAGGLSVDDLRGRVADSLVKEACLLTFLNGADRLSGESKLHECGLRDAAELTVVEFDGRYDPEAIRKIQKAMNVPMLPGLSKEKIARAEKKFGFRFPPELKAFFEVGLPEDWHNWEDLILDEVIIGGEFDTVSQEILDSATPEEEENKAGAREHPLIPIYRYRMMPSVPHKHGLPVLSCAGCHDMIQYGENFWIWLEKDKKVPAGVVPEEWKNIIFQQSVPFWDQYL